MKKNVVSISDKEKKGLLSSVLDYKHPELLARYQRELGVSKEAAEELFSDVKKYLYLIVITGERLVPTKAIDAGWHEFLLYTRDYANFCTRFFGSFIHHTPNPTIGLQVVSNAASTVAFAKEEFGALGKNWNRSCSADCAPDSECHGDGSCGGDV